MTQSFDLSHMLLATMVLLATFEGLLVHLCFAMHRALRLLAEINSTSNRSFDILASMDERSLPDCSIPGGLTNSAVAPDEARSPVRVDVQNDHSTGAEEPLSTIDMLPSVDR